MMMADFIFHIPIHIDRLTGTSSTLAQVSCISKSVLQSFNSGQSTDSKGSIAHVVRSHLYIK